ncbi:MAG: biotin--[acetyl-CoA-carboxylase] ligase [Gracilimonas sp.]
MFDTKLFEKHLATSWLGRSFSFFEELPSTNSYAKSIEGEKRLHGSLVLTDYQTKGRGQYERDWIVEAGKNLTFSLVFLPDKAERLTLLTLASALAIAEAIDEFSAISTQLKWPNDILHGGKKLCGLLTETQFTGNKLEKVVVGIGINVNQEKFQGELEETATSILLGSPDSGKTLSREKLLAEVLKKMEYCYRQWDNSEEKLVKDINQKMAGFGKWIKLKVNGETLAGKYKFLGVNSVGELVALNKDLDVRTFSYEQVRVQM